MSTLKEWVVQIRYPYTAGVIAVLWVGSAVLAGIRPELSPELILIVTAVVTLVVASIGFSSSRR